MTEMSAGGAADPPDALLAAIRNLSWYHREHEKYYASAPREAAVRLQAHARTLQALADRWSAVEPAHPTPFSPFEGAEDLNDLTAIQLDGVLFMEGEGRPAELTALVAELRAGADGAEATGLWLAAAMEASWAVAESLLAVDGVADLLGERHRIIANDWRAADMNRMIARLLRRAADIVDRSELTPAAVRGDLAADRVLPRRLFSAAELISNAADLYSESAGLVNDNERRWRVFRARVVELTGHDRVDER